MKKFLFPALMVFGFMALGAATTNVPFDSLTSKSANPATAGALRLPNASAVNWRNNGNSQNMTLSVNATDQLQYSQGATVVPLASTSGVLLNTAKTVIFDSSDTTKKWAWDLTGITTATTRTWTVPNADSTFVGTALTQTLTNKTLTGNTAVNLISGSGTLTLNTTGTITLPNATDTLVGKATTDTLTNKTLTAAILGAPVVSDALTLTEVATQSTPSSGLGKIYFKSDNKLYQLNDLGAESLVGSGSGGGGVNFMSANPDLESDATGYSTYADAAGATPVDCTGGSPSVTFARTTTNPLAGTGSGLFTKGATNRQGDGTSYTFSVDPAYRGKPQQIKFDLDLVSGTWAGSVTPGTPSDVTVWIYDVTNSQLIQPAGSLLDPMVTGQYYQYKGSFQTSLSGTSYRLCLHTSTTSASAYAFRTDNFSIGPPVISNGAAVTDRTAFTPTGSWSANTTYTGYWKRVGDAMEAQIRLSLAGAPTSATLTLNLPSGYTIDTAKLSGGTFNFQNLGRGAIVSAGQGYVAFATYNTTTSVTVRYVGSPAAAVTQAAPGTFTSADSVDITLVVPIVGWSSNVQMANDTDTRVVSTRTYRNTSTQSLSNATATKIQLNAASFDKTGSADTVTNFRILIPVPGVYQISGSVSYAASATGVRYCMIYKNGVLAAQSTTTNTGASDAAIPQCRSELELTAGDYIELYGSQSSGGALNVNNGQESTYLSVTRVSGPSQIAASETVAARYTSTAGQALTNSLAILDFGTKDFDDHGAVTTGASWKFTAPISGKYAVKLYAETGAFTCVAGVGVAAQVFKNGSYFSGIGQYTCTAAATSVGNFSAGDSIQLLSGDTLDIRVIKDSLLTTSMSTTAGRVRIVIERVGNY